MTLQYLEVTFATNAPPLAPKASDVALEAGTTEAMTSAYIAAAWEQAEAFTGRCYRGLSAGEVLIKVDAPTEYRWPRFPFPASIEAEVWSDEARDWEAVPVIYRAGYVELYPGNLYKLTQSPTAAVSPLPSHVIQAVSNLAIYSLIQLPQRREFRSTQFGDTSQTREALMGVLYGSGAGALLASEVRK